MRHFPPSLRRPSPWATPLSRRRFVTGLGATGLLAGMPFQNGHSQPLPASTPVLRGTTINLKVGALPVNLTGRERLATAINGTLPAPELRLREGDTVTLNVTNTLSVDTSIHWHGLILPYQMDGVPGISFPGIAPGETFSYRFTLQQSGTYWYHSHSGFQEQTGMYGALVIDPAEPDPISYDRDYSLVLSDWTDEDPHHIYATLKKKSHYYNFQERTVADLWRDIREKGVAQTWRDRAMWNEMRMSDRDLSDVTGYTYTFLINGQAPAQGWTGLFRPGEKVRLRIINASAMTFFDLRIPDLQMTVVAADGQPIEPVTVDEFRIGVAETYDVVVEPKADRAYCVFAQAFDRSGYARGTLTPDPALTAPVPALDPLPILTHTDMGMAHGGHGEMKHGPQSHSGMNHSGMNHGSMDHNAHHAMGSTDSHQRSTAAVVHPASEYGPHVDMHASAPRYRLDDPGVGLRDNGRRVLTYADLRNLYPTPDPRPPEREIQLHLTGNMSRYMWSIDGINFADAEPLHFRYGERLRLTFVNDTMMNHPMHLHGMWSDLESGDDSRLPRKHTVIVQPGSKLSYRVTADALGRWAFHCHLLYHMPGMMREVVVSEGGAA